MEASEGVGVGGGRTKGERDLRIPVNYNAKLWLYISDLILLGKCAFPLRLFLKNLHVEFIYIFIRSITKRN